MLEGRVRYPLALQWLRGRRWGCQIKFQRVETIDVRYRMDVLNKGICYQVFIFGSFPNHRFKLNATKAVALGG